MKPLLYVSGYCQGPGMSHVLDGLMPGWNVRFLDYPSEDPDSLKNFAETLRPATAWASADSYAKFDAILNLTDTVTCIRWPQIIFPAFHPDIIVAYAPGRQIFCCNHAYHSAILLWCYKNKVLLERATELFKPDVFERLGYFNSWSGSIKRLRQQFEACGMDFPHYYRSVKRGGVFMHSHDHAKIASIINVASQIASKLTGKDVINLASAAQYFDDALMHDAIWPVYPEIAQRLGVAGGYFWRIKDVFFSGLEEFARASYASYDTADFLNDTLFCERFTTPHYDNVLAAFQ